MQGKSEKGEAADVEQSRSSLRLRRHAAAEGFAAGDKGNRGHESGRLRHSSPNRRLRKLGSIRPFGALLHVGKLVAERGNAALTEFPCDRRHRSEEHTSELQSHVNLVCRLLLE